MHDSDAMLPSPIATQVSAEFQSIQVRFFSREGKRTTFTYPEIYKEDVSQPWLLSGQIWYHKVNCLNIFLQLCFV